MLTPNSLSSLVSIFKHGRTKKLSEKSTFQLNKYDKFLGCFATKGVTERLLLAQGGHCGGFF
jgi:hypothetical protein